MEEEEPPRKRSRNEEMYKKCSKQIVIMYSCFLALILCQTVMVMNQKGKKACKLNLLCGMSCM